MPKILVTAGPIPARVDSVKFITNRFKGRLALGTATYLKQVFGEDAVTVVAWKHTDLSIHPDMPRILVEDVNDYVEKVLSFEADAYVLAAAVANIGPKDPFEGKFPSHNYKVGETFPIDFTILPRAIDMVKDRYPRATLIGYKLFDGSEEELVAAAEHTLHDSKANLIFANHPATASSKKIAVTADGSHFEVSFEEHLQLMSRLIGSTWYRTIITEVTREVAVHPEMQYVIDNYPRHRQGGMTFGTFAIRRMHGGFLTTTRGKHGGDTETAIVLGCLRPTIGSLHPTLRAEMDPTDYRVYADKKATLNAPLLDALFQDNPGIRYLIHGHELIGLEVQPDYQFPGTVGDESNSKCFMGDFVVKLPHHGYVAGFSTFTACKEFLDAHATTNTI